MAEKYTIQVNPQVAPADGQRMENDLNRRFANVSKKFATNLRNGLASTIKYGLGAAGLGSLGAVLTNPFEKVQSNLKGVLATADDLVTRAQQFGVTTAQFTQLAAIAHSVGFDVDLALQQFSSKLQEARDFQKGDQTKSNALVQFVNDKNIIENFYDFIKSVQNLPINAKNEEISKVYTDKMQLKIAELMQQDIELRKKTTAPRNATLAQVGRAAEKTAALEDQAAILSAKRMQEDIVNKSRVINKGTIISDDAVERAKANKETQQLSEFQIFARQAALQEEMARQLDKIRAHIMDAVFPLLQKGVEVLGYVVDKLVIVIDWLGKVVAAVKKIKFWGG
jgi:hypothetical protein